MFLCCGFYFPLLIVLLPYACAGVWVCVCVRETVINSFNYPYKALYDYRDNRTHPTDLNYLDGPVIIIIIHVRVFFFFQTPFWYTVSVGNCTWIGAEIMVPGMALLF